MKTKLENSEIGKKVLTDGLDPKKIVNIVIKKFNLTIMTNTHWAADSIQNS